MKDYVFLVWEDARVHTSKTHGVVVLTEQDICSLVAEKFTNVTGLTAAHVELRATTSNPDDFLTDEQRFDLVDDM